MLQALTLEAANAALEQIESRTAQLAAMAAQTGNELADAEAALGEAVLNGDEGAVGRVAALRLRADGLSAGLGALERRKAAALIEQKRATAADLRRQAGEKAGELAALEKRTAKHLEGLSELEGVSYTACILASQRAGKWYTTMGGHNEPAPWLGPLEAGRDPLNNSPFAVPRSRLLRKQITDLESRAAAIEDELAAEAPAA